MLGAHQPGLCACVGRLGAHRRPRSWSDVQDSVDRPAASQPSCKCRADNSVLVDWVRNVWSLSSGFSTSNGPTADFRAMEPMSLGTALLVSVISDQSRPNPLSHGAFVGRCCGGMIDG